MSDTDQLIPEDLDDDEPLRAELRLCFVGSSGVRQGPPYQLQHEQDLQLGREKSCSLWIEDSVVSELHASVHPQLTDKGWQVELRDCESRNGTFVNGVKIDRCLLRSGDVIRVGNSLLHFQVSRIGDEDYPIPGVIGCSPAIRHLRTQIEVFAPTTNSILILGESGVGKEVVAQAIHKLSRRSGKLVATNCANIEKTLADSTLFGHKRGAFTGATEDRAGLFQTAHTGTLFLDEVGELAKDVQSKFLRALETKAFLPLGREHEVHSDARCIAATNVALTQAVDEGRFREDLYYRLAGVLLEVPPLRDRRDDILLLAQHFLPSPLKLTAQLAEALMLHSWPGNVRELRSLMAKVCELARAKGVTELRLGLCRDDLKRAAAHGQLPSSSQSAESMAPASVPPASVPPAPVPAPAPPAPPGVRSRELKPSKEELLSALIRCDWKILRVAKLTQWDRHSIRRWMTQYGLQRPEQPLTTAPRS
ncbi:MAG: sigma 54-interacting transcriptional regulator [Myxococcales bacterium]|nr:sigma 54-interacting transcriptional regulator [Myxococcales bacterium]